MARKLQAKELKKQDEFQQAGGAFLDRSATWVHENRTPIVVVIAILVVMAVGASLFEWWSWEREAAARDRLATALASVEKADEPGGDVSALLADARTRLDALVEEAGSTDSGRLASYYRGVVMLRQGEAEEAITALEGFIDDHPRSPLLPHALTVLAAAQEEVGEIEQARAALERLAEEDWELWPRDAALMELAGFHERQGRDEEADEIYRRLTEEEEFLESAYSRLARERLDG